MKPRIISAIGRLNVWIGAAVWTTLLPVWASAGTAAEPASSKPAAASREGEGAEGSIDFNRDIRPLLSNRCAACHGPDENERQAGLRLDTRQGAIEDLGGYAAIAPGDPEASELVVRITTEDSDLRMPPAGKGEPFSDAEIALLKQWIAEGAEYAQHWSYIRPVRPALPQVQQQEWPRNAIDSFVLARLEAVGLEPSPEADRAVLARRVALDLTGLPPSWEEAQRFIHDPRPDAYERFVDAQLAKPAMGERWARVWLDLARYADSAGYADDPARTIWAYRDYVIRSLNENKPFDQFTIEQIAGDLLENPSEEQLVATAFHRNTMTNSEGGTNDEQFRNEAVVDRVNTTMAVWMGTTMACAQCHTHKYDPLTQEEYFQLFAIFNQSADADLRDESPLHEVWSKEPTRQRNELAAQIAELKKQLEAEPDEAGKTQLEALEKQLAAIEPTTTVPVMRELPTDQQRVTKIQLRGNYQSTGAEVEAGVPAAFHPFPDGMPRNRLGLAHWLVDPHNPLTPRTIANRHWEQIFGVGIVETSEEFGSQGELPSHPELLDWLAVEVVESGWDLKRLLRLLVTSATYRQQSVVTPEMLERDPQNRLLARGPRYRISAEIVRDQALFVSGLLSSKMLGPPVRPPQPELGLKAAFGSATDWKPSEGADRYRRGIYTTWRRSNPYPSMITFDAPNREVCLVRRMRTNTPLQALVTLNDPVYVEAAQSLARRMAAAETLEERIAFGVRQCLIREPREEELERLSQLYRDVHKELAAAPGAARQLAEEPLGPLPKELDPVDMAALTVVANALLNLDEMLMPR
ncbi:PSD1 and planctomycete cytochrome C domain-containing protein [Candidatus Laterigemmans baculatus]|uniref:PSD1 and planctomycete cytochrome C domain-containing protein n=1 Tax=Candidatus Laterigemmans baculatus TaxID=2770505 RepID=UPI00193BE50A|nr:PSD1 and planctomycete cytochrome C domain-containing protein [Candidatus Laterigemmans baculatus]